MLTIKMFISQEKYISDITNHITLAEIDIKRRHSILSWQWRDDLQRQDQQLLLSVYVYCLSSTTLTVFIGCCLNNVYNQ